MAATIATIRRELSDGGLIRRNKAKADGPSKGAFLACSCWMADCLNMQGRKQEARAQFERVLAVANDLGLLSEEYNVAGKHLGCGQAFGLRASIGLRANTWRGTPRGR